LDDDDFLAAINEEVEMPPDNPELAKLFDSILESDETYARNAGVSPADAQASSPALASERRRRRSASRRGRRRS
jgi:hypothetical protein